jgi:hypothetical protein
MPCDPICVDPSSTGYESGALWYLGGVVSSRADEIRVGFAGRRAVRYPLTGPLVPGFPRYRVLLVDTGRRAASRLTLLRRGRAIASKLEPRLAPTAEAPACAAALQQDMRSGKSGGIVACGTGYAP